MQVRWKPSHTATGRSRSFLFTAVPRGMSSAPCDAERLKAYLDLHRDDCEVEEALAALGFVEVNAKAPSTGGDSRVLGRARGAARSLVHRRAKHDYLTTLRTRPASAGSPAGRTDQPGPTRPG